jgi:hypothetical protein
VGVVQGRYAAEVVLGEGRGIPDPLGVDHPDEGAVPHQGQLPLGEAGDPQLKLLGRRTEGLWPAGDLELEQGGEVGEGGGTHLVGARLKPLLGLAGVEALGEETAQPGLGGEEALGSEAAHEGGQFGWGQGEEEVTVLPDSPLQVDEDRTDALGGRWRMAMNHRALRSAMRT